MFVLTSVKIHHAKSILLYLSTYIQPLTSSPRPTNCSAKRVTWQQNYTQNAKKGLSIVASKYASRKIVIVQLSLENRRMELRFTRYMPRVGETQKVQFVTKGNVWWQKINTICIRAVVPAICAMPISCSKNLQVRSFLYTMNLILVYKF